MPTACQLEMPISNTTNYRTIPRGPGTSGPRMARTTTKKGYGPEIAWDVRMNRTCEGIRKYRDQILDLMKEGRAGVASYVHVTLHRGLITPSKVYGIFPELFTPRNSSLWERKKDFLKKIQFETIPVSKFTTQIKKLKSLKITIPWYHFLWLCFRIRFGVFVCVRPWQFLGVYWNVDAESNIALLCNEVPNIP